MADVLKEIDDMTTPMDWIREIMLKHKKIRGFSDPLETAKKKFRDSWGKNI